MAARRTLAAWTLLLGAGCAARQPLAGEAAGAPPADIVLGAVLPMSGEQQAFGLSVERGVRLALDEQNARGGVRGRRVVFRVADSRGTPPAAAEAMARLVAQERPLAVIGEVASSRTLAMLATAEAAQIPLVTPTATNPRVTAADGRVRPYVFRACAVDPFQGVVMARYAAAKGIRRVAILVDEGNGYSEALAARFRATFAALGGRIVSEQRYREGDQEFRTQLEAVRREQAEAIYLPGYYPAAASVALDARRLGFRTQLLGGDGWDSHKLIVAANGAMEGAWFTNHWSVEDPAPANQQFIDRYRGIHREEPDVLAVLGYDTANMILAAMERAASLTGPGLRDALEATRAFPAVSGTTTLDATHDAVKPMVILRVAGDAFRFVTRVEPLAE